MAPHHLLQRRPQNRWQRMSPKVRWSWLQAASIIPNGLVFNRGKNGKDCYGCEIIAEQVDFLAKAKESAPDTSEISETKATKRRSK